MSIGTIAIVLALGVAFLYLLSVPSLKLLGSIVGTSIQQRTSSRRRVFLSRVATDRKAAEESSDINEILGKNKDKAASTGGSISESQEDYDGIIGFLHPFCNAGGGGERVLWAAIRATQQKYPKATCVVYTGDHDVSKDQILNLVKQRFNIDLYAPSIIFLYLTTRQYVLATTWPRFTLLGQSLGSLALAWDAFHLLVPDIFIDTMGYAFTLALSSFFFPQVPTGAYVHYPTISTDMLASLDIDSDRGVNAGAGKGLRGTVKRSYWQWFAYLYGWVGGSVDVVMTNSSWTQNHVRQLWGPSRQKRKQSAPLSVVFPPVAVAELVKDIPLALESEEERKPVLLYIAQFRLEKNHTLVLRSFANFLHKHNSSSTLKETEQPQLLLIGSVRDAADEKYIYSLRLLAHELQITPSVTFVLNASWPTILSHLRTSSIGINAMWNEHFGIGVVEYQAAGLISVVNDSGGPKEDIVVAVDGLPTGFHASTEDEYAEGFANAMALGADEKVAMRKRARKSAERFGEDVFDERWLNALDKLVALTPDLKKKKKKST